MRKLLFLTILLPAFAFADTYDATVSWTDPTPAYPAENDAPTYRIEWRINGGASNQIYNLLPPAMPSDGHTWQITANPGDNVEIRVQNHNANTDGPLSSNWSIWYSLTAGYPVTQPSDPTNVNYTLIRTGP